MIHLIDSDDDHVLAVRVENELLGSDVRLAMNFLDEKVRTRDRIALYAEVENLTGVEGDVFKQELRHSVKQIKNLSHIERAAIVTDQASPSNGFGFEDLVPMVDVKFFPKAESEKAKAWAREGVPGK